LGVSCLDVVLKGWTETVVGESFAEFDDDDEPSADGDSVGNTSEGSQVLLRDSVVYRITTRVFAKGAGRVAGLGIARQVGSVLLRDEVEIAACNVVRKSSVVLCSFATVIVSIGRDARVFGHFEAVDVIVERLISYSGTRKPGGG